MAGFRTERLGRLVQEMLSALILESKIKDPRVSPFISITRVNVAGDLSFADVYVSNINNVAHVERNVKGLQSAAGYIQSQLGAALRIRKIPRLRFHADTGIKDGFDLMQKIETIVAADAAHINL